jgi:hypothetical protein
LSEVGIPLLDQVRYHLPVIGVIDQPCKLNNSFKRKVYLYDIADFSSYREQLSQVNFDNLFASDDIDSITRSIVKIFINEADKAIPNRIITVRKDNPPWLTTEIKQNIRKKIDNTNVQKKVIWQMTGQHFDELGTDATNL